MANKNILESAVMDFQKVVNGVIHETAKIVKEGVNKDISKKISEKVDDDDNLETDQIGDDNLDPVEGGDESTEELGSEEGTEEVASDDIPSEEGEAPLDGDVVASDEEGVEIPLDDVTPESEDETEIDLTGDIGAEGEGEVDTELSDVLGDIVDGTSMDDEQLIKVFKQITDDTNIEVVRDDDNTISFTNNGEKFIFKLNENDSRVNFIDALFNKEEEKPQEGVEDDTILEIQIEEADDKLDEVFYREVDFDKLSDEERNKALLRLLDGVTPQKFMDVWNGKEITHGSDSYINVKRFHDVLGLDLELEELGNDGYGEKYIVHLRPKQSSQSNNLETEKSLEEISRTHAMGRFKSNKKPEGFYSYASSRLRSGINESAQALENKKLINEAAELKSNIQVIEKENKQLNEEIERYSKAVVIMKEQLDTVALLNTKMLEINRLFCEHATTKAEKKNILERFDSVSDKKEIKSLAKVIASELNSTSKINESINKVKSSVSTTNVEGTSLLTESENKNVVNVDSDFQKTINRMLHLMDVENKKS